MSYIQKQFYKTKQWEKIQNARKRNFSFLISKCTGKTHGPSLHLNVYKCYKYWGCEDRFSRAETASTQKSSFFSSQLFGFFSREQCHTWVETEQKFFVSSRTECFKCKEQGLFRGSPEVVTSCFHLCGLHWYASSLLG